MNEELPFPLFGGVLRRLGIRIGLVHGTNSVMLGVALGLTVWVVLVLLAVVEGFGPDLFSWKAIAIHVRFLVVVPLLFVCETWMAPQIAGFTRYLVRSGVVPDRSMPALASAIEHVGRLSNSWKWEAVILVAAVLMPVLETVGTLPSRSASWVLVLNSAQGKMSWVHGLYLGICLPLFRFLILRWLWWLGLWWYFLWRLAKLELRLIPTHSDGAAGLGYLEVVHEHFTPLAVAFSALLSAEIAEELSAGSIVFESLYSLVPLYIVLATALFMGPLLLFVHKLWLCRTNGLSEYMSMASHYVYAFDRKWIRGENLGREPELGTPDLQSLADLTNSLAVVREMRNIPASGRLVVFLAVPLLLPFLPLLLLKYPVDQLAGTLFRMLTGL